MSTVSRKVEFTYEHQQLAVKLVERLLKEEGATYGLGNATGIGFVVGGELIGGFIYHNYDHVAQVCEISMASIIKPLRFTRRQVQIMFETPFLKFGCQAIVARVGENNYYVRNMLRRLKFTEHYIPRLRSRNEGEYVCVLTDDAWYESTVKSKAFAEHHEKVRRKNGQERIKAAAPA